MTTTELIETVKELLYLLDVADECMYIVPAFCRIDKIIFDALTQVPALFDITVHLVEVLSLLVHRIHIG